MTEAEIGFLKEELERVKNDYMHLMEENSRLKKDISSKAEGADLKALEEENKTLRELHDSTLKTKDEEIKKLNKDLKKKEKKKPNTELEQAKTELDILKKVIANKDSELTEIKQLHKNQIVQIKKLNSDLAKVTTVTKPVEDLRPMLDAAEKQLKEFEETYGQQAENIVKLKSEVFKRDENITALEKELAEHRDRKETIDRFRAKYEEFISESFKSKGRRSQMELGLRETISLKDQQIKELNDVVILLKNKLREVAGKLRRGHANGSETEIQNFRIKLYAKAEEAKILRSKHLQAAKFCAEVSKGFESPARDKFRQVAKFCTDVAEAKLDLKPEPSRPQGVASNGNNKTTGQ